MLPDGRMDLILRFRLSASGSVQDREIMIAGPSTRPFRVPVRTGDRFFGLRFRAGWGGTCLGIDPCALRDSDLSGPDAVRVLGADASRLLSATNANALKEALIVTGQYRAKAASRGMAPGIGAAIDLLHVTGGRSSLSNLARATDIPERTLRRQINASVGLSFKALAAILRFQRTVRLLQGSSIPAMTLGHAAYEGGYSDQAHMTREFRRYGGFTPGRQPAVTLVNLSISGLA